MIISSLKHSERIEGLHPQFKQLFDYVKSNNLLDAPLGRIVMDGDNFYINNVEVQGHTRESQVLETHEAYLDVHILLQGEETFGWKSTDEVTNITQPYNPVKDCTLADERATSYTTLKVGEFAIVYPEDAHAPNISDGTIRKLVAKIKL